MLKDATELGLVLNGKDADHVQRLRRDREEPTGAKWMVQPMFISPKPKKTSDYACSTAKDSTGAPIVDENGQAMSDQADTIF